MSVDLSDPQLAVVRGKIQDPNEATTWFLAHYASRPTSPTSSSLTSAISLLAAGGEPVLPSWQEHLGDTAEQVLFGYGEIGGKGLVLLYLRDSVGGVRRARAVVHSRAIASLFPDYSALITIAHPSQLTEDLITERLALNQPSTVPAPVQPKYTVPGSDHPNPLSPLAPGGPMPFLPSTSRGGSSRSVSANYPLSNSANESMHQPSPTRQRQFSGPGTPTRREARSSSQARVASLSDTPQRTASPGPVPSGPVSLDSPNRSQGISSSDYFKDEPTSARSRKTSFGARIKNTFTHRSSPSSDDPPAPAPAPASASAPSEKAATQPNSPTSPGIPRFRASSLAKAFHRRRSSQQANCTPPDSPRIDELHNGNGISDSNGIEYAPPVPPKDSQNNKGLYAEPRLPLASASGSAGTLGHGAREPSASGSARLPSASHEHQETTPDAGTAMLSPSPSAKRVLFDARQKSLSAETEIQERFRRDQEAKMRAVDNGHSREPSDGSVRLAYDESESEDEHGQNGRPDHVQHEHSRLTQLLPNEHDGHEGRSANGGSVHIAAETVDEDRTPRLPSNGTVAQAERLSQAAEEHAEREAAIRAEEERARQLAEAEVAASAAAERERLRAEKEEAERRVEEERQLEEERVRLEKVQLEERDRAEAEQAARSEREEEERRRLEAEDAACREAESEADRARVAAEAEAEERRRAELEAEERARLEREAAEREAEAERLRAEEERVREAEEKAKLEAEEKARLEKEAEERKAEEEVKRKAGIREGLARGKTEGGIMLRGWVTVQTYKSMTWRRRYFHLLPNEMQLFKAEGDAKPIQTIFIGPLTTVAERYDESQVKDSFKVLSDGPKGEEDYFLFTDSSEDKEVVLEGLRMCLG